MKAAQAPANAAATGGASSAGLPAATVPDPALPGSFLEVRVGPGRLEVVEFHSHDAARRLEAALARLGLDLETEFDAPCG